jgi:hypothetical protein
LLEKTDQLNTDSLALEISKRQRRDWRSQADLPINDPKVRHEIRSLSEQIARAIDRTDTKYVLQLSPALEKIREDQFRHNSELVQSQQETKRALVAAKIVLWVDDRPNNNVYERAAMKNMAYNFRWQSRRMKRLKNFVMPDSMR